MALDDYGFKESPKDGKPEKVRVLVDIKAQSLSELDLDQELLQQYKDAKQLFKDIELDDLTPMNQKAQIMNSITSILTKIVENQTALYDSERVKLIESILIDVLKQYPDINAEFMERYKKALEHAAGTL